jgi:hypothetical protein
MLLNAYKNNIDIFSFYIMLNLSDLIWIKYNYKNNLVI